MLYLLECALALEKHGTYHRTAQHLHVSQPTVTRAIQELERLFSVTLFDRTNRGSIPTVFGALLLARNCETTAPVNSTSSQTRWEKASDHAPVWTGQQKIVAIRWRDQRRNSYPPRSAYAPSPALIPRLASSPRNRLSFARLSGVHVRTSVAVTHAST